MQRFGALFLWIGILDLNIFNLVERKGKAVIRAFLSLYLKVGSNEQNSFLADPGSTLSDRDLIAICMINEMQLQTTKREK